LPSEMYKNTHIKMENITLQPNLSFETVWAMFQDVAQRFKETDKKFQDTDRKFQDTDRKFQDTDKRFKETDKKFQEMVQHSKETDQKFKEIHSELGGIGKSNGEIAEDFFYTALKASKKVDKLQFDFIDRNIHRERNKIEAEYDIVLYNKYKVLIVEVKYHFRPQQLRNFYKDKLKRFRTLYPEYSEYKLYGAIAALTFEKEVLEEAQNYGFYILSQNNDKMKLLNSDDFAPNEIK